MYVVTEEPTLILITFWSAKIKSRICKTFYKRDHTGTAKYDVKKLQKPNIAKEYAERIKANLHDIKQKDGENRCTWTVCKQALTQAANEILLPENTKKKEGMVR
jgi:hypothetical protein